ncbi:2-oxoacid:acceptor oxidoreductase family protein [Metallumcola ferriviriculae]|uniref:2-oxoacid:acceptor oxidoreductase family protein n=1 Tax=Metallumcola ferriviriculae TaxID=3039180 RepID=A0AAU0UIB0_9FIRM|nr:2-oxoacid:acceptor oxidoreductase family protein [Desulfitibacteraceae bacterium MK1]
MAKLLFAGFGGQGVLFTGQLLARCALREGYQVSWVPSYGPEMRGGTAHCGVIISRDKISSPVIDCPDILLAFNQPSLDKFAAEVAPEGAIILNSSLVTSLSPRADIRQYLIEANQWAEKLGAIKAANMVMLGALVKLSELVKKETILTELATLFPTDEKLIALNNQALTTGYRLLSDKK